MRVAVVGSGVAGLTAARTLAQAGVDVVLYEKEKYVGGHARSLRFSHDGDKLDVGFIPFDQATYSDLIPFFEDVGVEVESCDMSFGVSITEGKTLEWSSAGFAGLFAQKRNFLNPFFWKMMREILKFGTDVPRYLHKVESNDSSINTDETLGEFLESHGYSKKFKDDYLIPICRTIWSCASEVVLTLSAALILTFISDNSLLQLSGRSKWVTMKGGPQTYVAKVIEELKIAGATIKTSTLVTQIKYLHKGSVQLEDDKGGVDVFDECIVAAPASDALQMRGEDATTSEKNVLRAFKYFDCDIYLHRDAAFMPKRMAAWSALNVLEDKSGRSFATYWLNHIQNLGDTGLPFLVTLNPPTVPQHVEKHWRTKQPVPTVEAANALEQLRSIQGGHGVWYCGSYQGFGSSLPGVGLKTGLETAKKLLGQRFEGLGSANRILPSWSEYAARQSVIAVLDRFIRTGSLRLVELGGSILDFTGNEKGCNSKCILQVNNLAFYWKIATKSDLGLSHAFIDGDFSFPGDNKKNNLCQFVEFIIANMELAKARTENQKSVDGGWWNPLFVTATVGTAVSYIVHLLRDNSLSNSRRNISDHYDMSNEMFSLFMDETMTYSCGIFKGPNDTLKDAQLRKLHLLIDKARINSTHEVLEIGFGWGSMAIEVVRRTGCRYTGISLSVEQLKYAQNRVKEAGLEDRITLKICDYRALPGHHKFDRIIACEMIEHLGHNYQKTFFDRCDFLLAKNGLVVLQASSVPDDMYDSYRRSGGFIKELFPGGNLPCLSVLATAAASKFSVEQMENIGPHYYQTLMYWQENLLANSSEIKRHGFDDRFIRKMVYFFSFCAAGFRSCAIGCIQVVLSRPGNVLTLGNPAICFPPVLSNEEAWKRPSKS